MQLRHDKKARRFSIAPTLSDVADAAGVSSMTVSRVINGNKNVRPAARERVTAAIRTLNYTPNSAARALVGAAQARIALVYGNPSATYLAEVLLGGLEAAGRSDVQLVLEESRTPNASTIGNLLKQRLDGVILPPPFSDSLELIAALRAAHIPTAVIATAAPPAGVFSVAIDDKLAAREMTAHLIALGHRRVGFIVGNPNQTSSSKRLEGYKAALQQARIAFDPKLVAQGDFTYRSGMRTARRLLAIARRPTAIFASNDDMAAAAVAAAHIHCLEVPHDVSICGFDDTALATTISPELTTIRQPVAEMTKTAVAMLAGAHRCRRRGQKAQPEHRLFAHQLIRRKSDAAPPL